MNYNNSEFLASYGLSRQLPDSDRPEIVFSGRSNVGKSSLINKLCTRTLYDPDGQSHVRVDEYMKRRLEIKLIHSIVSMS